MVDFVKSQKQKGNPGVRVATGAIYHRTNTFSKRLTSLADFSMSDQWDGLIERDPDLQRIITHGASLGITHLPLIYASAIPSGLVSAGVVDQLIERLRQPLLADGPSIGAVVLRLSGAMVAQDHMDPETVIISELRRAVGSDVPVIAIVDGAANVSREMSRIATIVISEPDQFSTSEARILTLLKRLLDGSKPRHASWRSLPLLSALPLQNREIDPLAQLVELTDRMMLDRNVLSVAIATGFPFADTPQTGVSVAVSTDGSKQLADSRAGEVARAVWQARDRFQLPVMNLEEAVHAAMQATESPSTLIDLGDDLSGGAPGDGTALLWALLDLGTADAALAPFVDAAAFDMARTAGAGAHLELDLGGRVDTRHGYPIPIRARVLKTVEATEKMSSSTRNESDLAEELVVLRAEGRHGGAVDIVLTHRPPRLPIEQLLGRAGFEPGSRNIMVLKTSAGLGQFVERDSQMIYVLTPGTTTADFAFFDHHHLRRPIYPLDDVRDESVLTNR